MGTGDVVAVVDWPALVVVVFDEEFEPEHPASARAEQRMRAETDTNGRLIK
jgi:hypothetical protein